MRWTITIPQRVRKRIANVPDPGLQLLLVEIIEGLAHDPTDRDTAVPLVSAPGAWRIRIGNWRLLYVLFPNENPPEVVLGDAVQRAGNTYTKARLRRLMNQARLRRNP